MKIRCIALDLDRTTLNPEGLLSAENRKALEAAIDAGIHVVVASGRAADSLPEEICSLKGIRYAITSNGTAVHDLETGSCLRSFRMTPDSVRQILTMTRDEEVVFEAFLAGKAYAQKEYVEDPVRFGATPHAVGYIKKTRTPLENMREFMEQHADCLDCLDLVVKREEKKKELWERLEKEVEDIYVTSSVSQLLEVSYREGGKESGLRFLMKHLGLNRKELAAFGDGDNDCGMLELAEIGIAVANASPACRQAADWIVASCQDHGVAEGIMRILGGQDGAVCNRGSAPFIYGK